MSLKNRISSLLISTLLIILTACSSVSSVDKFSDALINSTIGESKISYGVIAGMTLLSKIVIYKITILSI